MYIMCVILRLFSALSRRVGALQISIIIIIVVPGNRTGVTRYCAWFFSRTLYHLTIPPSKVHSQTRDTEARSVRAARVSMVPSVICRPSNSVSIDQKVTLVTQ